MKRESLADLGYIRLYIQQYVNASPLKGQEFNLTRALELTDAIVQRETGLSMNIKQGDGYQIDTPPVGSKK